jgi:hypothetical protein
MKKYVWSWSGEYGNYINTADSLERIVNEVLDNYYYESDSVIVKVINDRLDIEIMNGEIKNHYEVEESEDAVCEFLQKVSYNMGRPDKFSIENAEVLLDS